MNKQDLSSYSLLRKVCNMLEIIQDSINEAHTTYNVVTLDKKPGRVVIITLKRHESCCDTDERGLETVNRRQTVKKTLIFLEILDNKQTVKYKSVC